MNRRYKKASSRIAKRRKARKYVGIFLAIFIPAIILTGIIFLLRANFMQIKDWQISGAEAISQDNIKNTAAAFASGDNFFVIPKSNIFLFSKDKLAALLLSKFGRIESVKVNKEFFGGEVNLEVTERKADFVWCSTESECFFMTKGGFIFEKIPDSPPANFVVFRGILEGDPIFKNFASAEKMQNYSKLIDTFSNSGFKITSINIESSDKAVAKSDIGDIIFSPDEKDLSTTAQNVILLINEIKGKNHSTQFNYIDARFGNKVYYKLY